MNEPNQSMETSDSHSSVSTDSTYNGWANYPTWNVNLWLGNDEQLYNETLDKVRFEIRHDDEDNMLRVHVADALRDWVRDELAPDLGASFAADLLGYALDEVDWQEIADSWIEAAAEQVSS